MLLTAYVKAALLLAGVPHALEQRTRARRTEDGGLATLEWVALAIVAVTLAAGAFAGIQAVINRKIAQIP